MRFHRPWRNLKENKRVVSVSDLYPRSSMVLTDFLPQFTKGLTQFVVFRGIGSSVGPHCASLLAQLTSIRGASLQIYIPSHCTLPALASRLLRVYRRNIRITLRKNWTRCAFASKLHQTKSQIHRRCKNPSDPKSPRNSSLRISASFSLFPNGLYGKSGSRCFHTAVQARQILQHSCTESHLAGWLQLSPGPTQTQHFRFTADLGSLEYYQRRFSYLFFFLRGVCRASWRARQSNFRQQPAKSRPSTSPSHLHLSANQAPDIWHLEFEIACVHQHVENRLSCFFSLSLFQHFPPRFFLSKDASERNSITTHSTSS